MLRLDSVERRLLELEDELLEEVEEALLFPLEARLLLELEEELELRLELEELEEELLELVLLTDIGLSCGLAALAFPPGLTHRMPATVSRPA